MKVGRFLPLLFLLFVFACDSSPNDVLDSSNNSFETANVISTGTSVSGAISLASNKKYFKFSLSQDIVISSSLLSVEPDLKLAFSLYNSTEVLLGGNQAPNPGELFEEYFLLSADDYFLVVTRVSGPENLASFSFHVDLDLSDLNETNNTIESATVIELGQEIDAAIRPHNDVDYYLIDINQDFLNLAFRGTNPFHANVTLSARDESISRERSIDYSGGPGAVRLFSNLPSGVYLIGIEKIVDDLSHFDYQIAFE